MRTIRAVLAASLLAACAHHAHLAPAALRLSRVTLYQNGIGYFERRGHVGGDTLHLAFARGELDDALKTLTVIDRLGASVATVDVPTVSDKAAAIELGVRLSAGRVHDLSVGYAVPTPTWKAAYRVVMSAGGKALLQAWAMVDNRSQEDWRGVALTLATGAPMSFATDLHTAQWVSRPDATGHLVTPTVTGTVEMEQAGAAAFDRDGDGILDSDDKCPDEPETYNGFDDDDGCPDRGRVVVTATAIEVLDMIYFTKGSGEIAKASLPILDAIAATLVGNPEITKVQIGGHAGEDEAEPWGLAARRAEAVRAALVARGVAGSRLVTAPFGATRPLDTAATEAAHAKNRRVDFVIVARADSETGSARDRRSAPPLDAATLRASVHTATHAADVAGAVRYALTEPVTIPRGGSSMVSIVNASIGSEDAYLFRPDEHAPGSERHPFRAVRLVNDSGFTLEPGPIAIFARGTFVGDSLLGRLAVGELAWVPYAVDGATTVTVETTDVDQPIRIVAAKRGVITVENADVHTTRYTIAAGREPAAKIYLRHAKRAGFALRELPPGTIDQGDAYLVPLPLEPGKTSVLALEERRPTHRTIELRDSGATQLGLYVDGSHLDAAVAAKLRAAIGARAELGDLEAQLEDARGRVGELAERSGELRENLRALDKVRGADELRKRLVAGLVAATADSDALARTLAAKTEALVAARGKLIDALDGVTIEP